eukprot:m51a1_g14698 hypothetical protein (850) ;mRNA; f:116473-121526
MSTRTERIFAAFQGPVLSLDSAVLHMYHSYTAELLLPRRWRLSLGLTPSAVSRHLTRAVVRADDTPASPPLRCKMCGDVVEVSDPFAHPGRLPDDLESFCATVRTKCTSSRKHLGSATLVLTVDVGGVMVCSGRFAVFAREPGRCKKRQKNELAVQQLTPQPQGSTPDPRPDLCLRSQLMLVVQILQPLPSPLTDDAMVMVSESTGLLQERVPAFQGPVLSLDSAVLHMYRSYTAELLLPRRWRLSLGLSAADVRCSLTRSSVRADASPSSPPLRCPMCGDVVEVSDARRSAGLPDDLESFCATVRTKCTSSRRHLGTATLVLTVDMGGAMVCSGRFSVFAREPGRYKKKQPQLLRLQQDSGAEEVDAIPDPRADLPLRSQLMLVVRILRSEPYVPDATMRLIGEAASILQGPVLSLDSAVLHMFRTYTAELLLPCRWRLSLGLSASDVLSSMHRSCVRADVSPSSPPLRCPMCGDVLEVSDARRSAGLPDDLESFCATVRTKCTSSRKHLGTETLVLTVDVGGAMVCSGRFSVFAREPGRYKKRRPQLLRLQQASETGEGGASPDPRADLSLYPRVLMLVLVTPFQGPVLSLDGAVLHMYQSYTAELLLPRRWRLSLGLSAADVFGKLVHSSVRDADTLSAPLRCALCGPVLVVEDTWVYPGELPDDLESYCATVRTNCTSSRRHMGTETLVLTMDVGGALVCSGRFSVFAREPGRYKKKRRGLNRQPQLQQPQQQQLQCPATPTPDPARGDRLLLRTGLMLVVQILQPHPNDLTADALSLVDGAVKLLAERVSGFLFQKSSVKPFSPAEDAAQGDVILYQYSKNIIPNSINLDVSGFVSLLAHCTSW